MGFVLSRPVTPSIRPLCPPTGVEAHRGKMHVGYHPCDERKQVRAAQIRMYKKTEQVHETRLGHTWSMDI